MENDHATFSKMIPQLSQKKARNFLENDHATFSKIGTQLYD
jgi:hypothetical protein